MKHLINVRTSKFSWLGSSYQTIDNSIVSNYYEPDTIEELENICKVLNKKRKKYLVIGHTSNVYFTPNCYVDSVVSTRKLTTWKIMGGGKFLECECGVNVKRLSLEMIKHGYKGFSGLCDLPGTVASAIYGNAGCYECDLSSKLYSCDVLLKNGLIKTFVKDDLNFSTRMSSFKDGSIKGVILKIVFFLEAGSTHEENLKANIAHLRRKETQPGPLNNLGSIYSSRQIYTLYGRFITILAKLLSIINKKDSLYNTLLLSGNIELLPYIYRWNRYIWKDEKAHRLWPSFVRLHSKIFRNDKFEIEFVYDKIFY